MYKQLFVFLVFDFFILIWISLIMPRHEWSHKNRKSDASYRRSVADKEE